MKKYEITTCVEQMPMVSNEVEIETTDIETENFDDLTLSDNEKHPSEKPTKTQIFFNESEYYNGAVHDTYCWSQTDNDFEINVVLPEYIKSSKEFKLNVTSSKLLITDRSSKSNVILEGDFKEKCHVDSLLWSFSNGKLQISLGKYI